jgi:hypothetical protein
LVGIEPDKLVRRIHFDASAVLGIAFQRLQASFDMRLIDLGHRGQFGVLVGLQGLGSRAAATAPAADQSYFDGVGDSLRRENRGKPGADSRA